MSAATSARRSFQFSSPAGRALCRSILARHFPYAPHDYQLDGVCQALDGVDVLAVTPTGSGKTGFMTMYMVIARELACEPSLYPGPGTLPAAFKKNAMMLVVCPTKSLEMDMQPKFQAVGLSTLAINADTMEKARHEGRNLWEEACTPNIAALLLAPEQLKSKGFERLLANKDSASRIIAMGVDEVHLLVSWGAQFRPVFRQIGNVRLRLPGLAVLIGLTATLRPGPHVQAACGFLGLRPGAFHYIRRSNARHDIRLIFRDMQSGQRAMQFPELDWVLRDDRRIIIFCSTIALGFRVASYLWDQAAQLPDCAQRIRMYNALNWPSYNSDTLTFMQSDSRSRVTIATDTLAVGIDAAQTDDVVIYGDTPPDTDMLLQKIGRIRDGSSRRSRAFIYLPRTAADAAKKVLATPASNMPSKAVPKSSRKDTVQLDSSIARLIIAKCKVDEIDSLYGNNEAEVPCECPTCIARPRVLRKSPCDCSGCMSDLETRHDQSPVPSPLPALPSSHEEMEPVERQVSRPKGPRAVTKKMKEHGAERLVRFRMQLWAEADECDAGMIPSMLFFPDSAIKAVLDDFNAIINVYTLVPVVYKFPLLDNHHDALFSVIQELQLEFESMHLATKLAANAKRKETRERKAREAAEGVEGGVADMESGSGESESHSESEDAETSDLHAVNVSTRRPLQLSKQEAAPRRGQIPANNATRSAGRIVIPPLRRAGTSAEAAHHEQPSRRSARVANLKQPAQS